MTYFKKILTDYKGIASPSARNDINPDFAIAKSARLVPAFRFTFVNLQGRADRLNPRGFNLARRGNPKQISNQTVS